MNEFFANIVQLCLNLKKHFIFCDISADKSLFFPASDNAFSPKDTIGTNKVTKIPLLSSNVKYHYNYKKVSDLGLI